MEGRGGAETVSRNRVEEEVEGEGSEEGKVERDVGGGLCGLLMRSPFLFLGEGAN